MEHYEIRDMFRRSTSPDLYLTLSASSTLQFEPGGDFSRPVALHFSIGNRSNQPAHYVIVTIGIDRLLQLESYGDYDVFSLTKDEDGDAVTSISIRISPPNWMPIFKEALDGLSNTPLTVAFHNKSLSIGRYLVKAKIRTPGFIGQQWWEISAIAGQVQVREFEPPDE
jgi:hypothetical protein